MIVFIDKVKTGYLYYKRRKILNMSFRLNDIKLCFYYIKKVNLTFLL